MKPPVFYIVHTMNSLDMISISTQKQFFITKLVLLNLEVRCISNEQGYRELWFCDVVVVVEGRLCVESTPKRLQMRSGPRNV